MAILAVTGHRPGKLLGYSPAAMQLVYDFAISEIRSRSPRPDRILTGLALGWDQAIALACVELGIPFEACVPCDHQESRWPEKSQITYRCLLGYAAKVTVVHPGPYAAWKMLKRNEYMVDHSSELLALWNGSAGGTGYTVEYAKRKQFFGIEIENCWGRWLAFQPAAARVST